MSIIIKASDRVKDLCKKNGFLCHINSTIDELNIIIMSRYGEGMCRMYLKKEDNLFTFCDLSVMDDYRQQGIGTSLLQTSLHISRLYGIDYVELKVLSESWMKNWYLKMGFNYFVKEDEYDWLIQKVL